MQAIETPSVSGRPVVAQSVPSAVVVIAITALALGLGIHVGVWVNTARPEDDSIYGLIPWLAYPGIVAAIAVRSRIELLASGLAAAVPVAAFSVLYGAERVRTMGIGVLLGYAALIVISVSVASRFARRSGPRGFVAALIAGPTAFLLAFGCVILWLTLPAYS